jgi:hypothetical protein
MTTSRIATAAALLLLLSIAGIDRARGGTLPENKWTKLSDCPPDPLGRELQPGRGAYWSFDPASAKFYRYGGYTPTDCNALWSFDVAARKWDNVMKVDYTWPPKQDRPGAGAWWSTCYDSKRKVIWMHGGSGVAARSHKALFNDIWQYDPAKKTYKAMKSKKWPSWSARIVYDSKNDLILRAPAAAREWANRHNKGRTWVYDPNKNAWEGRATKGSPGAFSGTVWVFDTVAGKAVYLAGARSKAPGITWTYDAAANKWENLAIKEAPLARVFAGACYDPHNKQVIVYGGVGHPGKGYGYCHRGGGLVLNDTWALDVARKKWKQLDVGAPVIPVLPGGSKRRFILRQAMDYDTKHQAVVVSAPTFGVWALRYHAADAKKLPNAKIATSPAPFEKPQELKEPVFKKAPPNKKLLDLEPGKWVKLGGGRALGGGEIPLTYDAATGFCLKYGGCNNGGTTFASGYGNDLSAYDPAVERWIALRWVDPCGPPRPRNGCTRAYAYDPGRKVNWFLGGTSGNHLASSTPVGGPTGGTWMYDGLKDKYVLVPSSGKDNGIGVVVCWDKVNKLIIAPPKQGWQRATVAIFDPAKKAWSDGAKTRAQAYTCGCYVDTLKSLFVIEPGKGGPKTLTYSAPAKAWKEIPPKGDKLPASGRGYVAAYDPENDAIICCVKGSTFVFKVKTGTWQDLKVKSPVGELMTYDSRHKVFLGCSRARDMHAFKYKPGK